MTPLQYERWKDFALRMVRVLDLRSGVTRKWVREQVEWFFDDCDEELAVKHISDWDDSEVGYARQAFEDRVYSENGPRESRFVNDDAYQRAYESWRERWINPVTCCVRAGLDVACEPSGGVVGFTVGDLRKMYPEGIPDWVATPEKPFTDDDGKPIDLRTRPDDEGVWL